MQWFCCFQKISSKMKCHGEQTWLVVICRQKEVFFVWRGARPIRRDSHLAYRFVSMCRFSHLRFHSNINYQTNNQFTPQSKRKEYMVLKGGYKYGRDIKELPLTDVPQLLICVKKPERIPTFQARRRRAAFKTQVCMATAWLSVSYSSCDALSSLERLTKQQISTRHIIAQIGRKNIIFYHSKASSDFEKTYYTAF